MTPQPLGNEAGDCLLWNGNVFGGGIDVSCRGLVEYVVGGGWCMQSR